MKHLLKSLNQKPIAYYPIYRQITGSTTAGILLSQLMYWFSRQDKIYKTDKEIMQETLLTENELKSAKNKIKKLDFVEVSREGLPARTYYKIDWEMYEICLDKLAQQNELNPPNSAGEIHQDSLVKSTKLDELNPPNSAGEIHQTVLVKSTNPYHNTENTTENTTEKKNIKKEKPKTNYPPELNVEAFEMWVEYKGKSYSKQGKTLSINKLIKYPKEIQMQMVENSIMNNYKGLFEIKLQNNQTSRYRQTKQVIDPFELYTKYRNAGMDREVATVRVINETGLKYPATDDFKKAVANAEYELYMQQKAMNQSQQPTADELEQRMMKELFDE